MSSPAPAASSPTWTICSPPSPAAAPASGSAPTPTSSWGSGCANSKRSCRAPSAPAWTTPAPSSPACSPTTASTSCSWDGSPTTTRPVTARNQRTRHHHRTLRHRPPVRPPLAAAAASAWPTSLTRSGSRRRAATTAAPPCSAPPARPLLHPHLPLRRSGHRQHARLRRRHLRHRPRLTHLAPHGRSHRRRPHQPRNRRLPRPALAHRHHRDDRHRHPPPHLPRPLQTHGPTPHDDPPGWPRTPTPTPNLNPYPATATATAAVALRAAAWLRSSFRIYGFFVDKRKDFARYRYVQICCISILLCGPLASGEEPSWTKPCREIRLLVASVRGRRRRSPRRRCAYPAAAAGSSPGNG